MSLAFFSAAATRRAAAVVLSLGRVCLPPERPEERFFSRLQAWATLDSPNFPSFALRAQSRNFEEPVSTAKSNSCSVKVPLRRRGTSAHAMVQFSRESRTAQ